MEKSRKNVFLAN